MWKYFKQKFRFIACFDQLYSFWARPFRSGMYLDNTYVRHRTGKPSAVPAPFEITSDQANEIQISHLIEIYNILVANSVNSFHTFCA